MDYRPLTQAEVGRLVAQGNSCSDWSGVEVSAGFDASAVMGSVFSGSVKIGATGAEIKAGGVVYPSGIYNARVVDCTIGDNTLISNTGGVISGYDIGSGCVIANVDVMTCGGESSFGNGVRVAAVNENGGRAVPIFDGLTSQVAYIMAMYRHRSAAVAALEGFVADYCDSVRSRRATVGSGTVIRHCGMIRDVRVGDNALLEGVSLLENGTVQSNHASQSKVCAGVVAKDFIMAPGAYLGEGVNIKACFVGEGCKLDRGFAAEESLFFACSDMALGEACSVFAGPYTVSHHRSTLLIAGLFSFFNAGSGANQSNHLYKSGPVHQGINRRGCKYGSDAYVMLPARTGAFTVVTGRHYSHHDTDCFPFSYLVDREGKSFLMPGANLHSYGTLRDSRKWPERDRRKGEKHDLVCFDMFNPAVVGKVEAALKVTEELLSKPEQDLYTYNRVKIKRSMLTRGAEIYRSAISMFLAGKLGAGDKGAGSPLGLWAGSPLFGGMSADTLAGDGGEWVDLAGLVVPAKGVDILLDAIESGEVKDMAGVEAALKTMYDAYDVLCSRWALSLAARMEGKDAADLTAGDIERIVEEGAECSAALERVLADDLEKDFSPVMATGYGVDSSDAAVVEADFNAVRR